MGKKVWMVDFQHRSEDGIKCRRTCVEGKDIREALNNAELRIHEYMQAAEADDPYVITDAGIAEDESRYLLSKIWVDPCGIEDPELFEED